MKKIIPFPWNFPLSTAIIHNQKFSMEISWFIGMNFDKNILEIWIEKQTKRAMNNIKESLEKVWWNMWNIIKTKIFLINMNDYDIVNKIYSDFFEKTTYPTRVAMEVSALPAWALIEIECIASWDTFI